MLERIIRVMAVLTGVLTAAAVAALVLLPAPAVPVQATPAAVRLYDWHGRMPIGITLSGLQAYLFGERNVLTMENQMRAARLDWHANTIRLQIIQDKLVGQGGQHYRPQYMRYIRQLVAFGLRQHLTMVLNAQTEESTGWAAKETMPTRATFVFWAQMMRWYKNNPAVVFDLFNEPRHTSWARWAADMQALVNYVRRAGAGNWVWVEGRWWGSTLDGAPLLHDRLRRLAYTYHHAGAPWDYQNTPTVATWDAAFGNLAEQGQPVIDAEFANYVGSYDWTHPARTVRQYLAYMTAHHIGMLAWSLLPGALNSTASYASASQEPQGDGVLVKRWFAQQAATGNRNR